MARKFYNAAQKSANLAKGILLYGKHPVFQAIANPNRIFHQVFATADVAPEVKSLLGKAGRDASLLKIVERKEFDKLFPKEAVHQGVAASVEPLESVALEDVIAQTEQTDNARILILDQVTDPQNVGAIIRSCAAFSVSALVVQDKNSPQESGAMAKASAGTIEFLPICRVTNLSRAIDALKKAGFWCLGLDGYAEVTLDKANKSGKIALIMGSEGKGMRRLVEENCDQTVKLVMNPKVESLNVSTAAAIALYEFSKF